VVRHIFQACPVWIYTQSNITSNNRKNVTCTVGMTSEMQLQVHPCILNAIVCKCIRL
jgi:hypothetical protein